MAGYKRNIASKVLMVLSFLFFLLGFAVSMMKDNFVYFGFWSILGIPLAFLSFLARDKTKSSHKNDTADELIKWNQLRESGAITQAEFETKKSEILKSDNQDRT